MADNQVSLYKKTKSEEENRDGQESDIQEGEQVNEGIEEQEVEYVTLMSNDNHEYILERNMFWYQEQSGLCSLDLNLLKTTS